MNDFYQYLIALHSPDGESDYRKCYLFEEILRPTDAVSNIWCEPGLEKRRLGTGDSDDSWTNAWAELLICLTDTIEENE